PAPSRTSPAPVHRPENGGIRPRNDTRRCGAAQATRASAAPVSRDGCRTARKHDTNGRSAGKSQGAGRAMAALHTAGRKVQDRLLFRPGRLPWHRCPVVPDFWGDMHVTVRRSGRTRIVAALGLAALAFAVSAAGTAAPASAVQTAQNAIVSADPVGWTPHVLDGRVKAIVQAGNTIVLGGS